MDFTQVCKASNGTFASPSGHWIAFLSGNKLTIRSTIRQDQKRVIAFNQDFASKIQFIKWSPKVNDGCADFLWDKAGLHNKRRSGIDKTEEEGGHTPKILVADDEVIHVYDIRDEKWSATIHQGFGGIRNVEWGRNADEVLVFSEFQLKVTAWSLRSSKHVDIPNPKFATKGFGYRPRISHFALLTRLLNHDVVTIRCHTTYKDVVSFNLPTLDAQGLKWSPCGKWLAVWDSATAGYKVLIYTADGRLFRSFEKVCEGLGVKTVEWSAGSEFLAIGSYDGRISFLSTYTFSPVIEMNHTSTIRLPGVLVWSECATPAKERHYLALPQPISLPTVQPSSANEAQSRLGISTIAFNEDCTLVATRNDSMPTTVWIWSLKLLRPFAVLVHLAPIKNISWHPTIPDLLMLTCQPEAQIGNSGSAADKAGTSVYLWSASWKTPRIVSTPIDRITGNSYVKWVATARPTTCSSSTMSDGSRSESPEKLLDKKPALIFGHAGGYCVGYVDEEVLDETTNPITTIEEQNEGLFRQKSWNPRDWAVFSPTHSNRRSTTNGTTPLNSRRSDGDTTRTDQTEDTFDYRAQLRRISMRS